MVNTLGHNFISNNYIKLLYPDVFKVLMLIKCKKYIVVNQVKLSHLLPRRTANITPSARCVPYYGPFKDGERICICCRYFFLSD